MCGPVLIAFGTQEQQSGFLPKILSIEDYWCQGYSEPGSGSDLASLKTRAEDKGDHYVVNGHKIWTTHAHNANRIFLLVRTDQNVKPQAGISFLLVDMDSPGINVKPIITLAGDHEVNEVFSMMLLCQNHAVSGLKTKVGVSPSSFSHMSEVAATHQWLSRSLTILR